MPWIELEHADIYYVEEGAGQPLVFLHGMSSCAEAWWQQFGHFRDRFRCIAYDSVNHGHSSNSPRDEDEPTAWTNWSASRRQGHRAAHSR
jgi:pimeloyl-ACP methyl ester carboxylesterase